MYGVRIGGSYSIGGTSSRPSAAAAWSALDPAASPRTLGPGASEAPNPGQAVFLFERVGGTLLIQEMSGKY